MSAAAVASPRRKNASTDPAVVEHPAKRQHQLRRGPRRASIDEPAARTRDRRARDRTGGRTPRGTAPARPAAARPTAARWPPGRTRGPPRRTRRPRGRADRNTADDFDRIGEAPRPGCTCCSDGPAAPSIRQKASPRLRRSDRPAAGPARRPRHRRPCGSCPRCDAGEDRGARDLVVHVDSPPADDRRRHGARASVHPPNGELRDRDRDATTSTVVVDRRAR